MQASYSKIAMLGAAPDVHDGMASAVETLRGSGLFTRWPIEFFPTRWAAGLVERSQRTVRTLRDLAVLVARERRVVAHIHAAADGAFWLDCAHAAVLAAARCPLILQLHGGGYDRLYDGSGSAGRAVIAKVIDSAAAVVVPSEALRHWASGISRRANIHLIPPPVRTAAPGAARNPEPIVLFLGRLDEERGVLDAVEAVATLRRNLPDARLVCAGDGDRGAVMRYADRLGVRDAVQVTGWLGPSGKRTLFETAAVLVHPAYSAGLPLGVLEAMAAGLPVVASTAGANPEAIADGAAGFLVAPGDTATLSRLLQKLLSDRALAMRVGAAARESVRLRHAPERVIGRLEELYAALGVAPASAPHAAQRHLLREAA